MGVRTIFEGGGAAAPPAPSRGYVPVIDNSEPPQQIIASQSRDVKNIRVTSLSQRGRDVCCPTSSNWQTVAVRPVPHGQNRSTLSHNFIAQQICLGNC